MGGAGDGDGDGEGVRKGSLHNEEGAPSLHASATSLRSENALNNSDNRNTGEEKKIGERGHHRSQSHVSSSRPSPPFSVSMANISPSLRPKSSSLPDPNPPVPLHERSHSLSFLPTPSQNSLLLSRPKSAAPNLPLPSPPVPIRSRTGGGPHSSPSTSPTSSVQLSTAGGLLAPPRARSSSPSSPPRELLPPAQPSQSDVGAASQAPVPSPLPSSSSSLRRSNENLSERAASVPVAGPRMHVSVPSPLPPPSSQSPSVPILHPSPSPSATKRPLPRTGGSHHISTPPGGGGGGGESGGGGVMGGGITSAGAQVPPTSLTFPPLPTPTSHPTSPSLPSTRSPPVALPGSRASSASKELTDDGSGSSTSQPFERRVRFSPLLEEEGGEREKGEKTWPVETMEPSWTGNVIHNATVLLIADVDEDGQNELLVATSDREIHSYSVIHRHFSDLTSPSTSSPSSGIHSSPPHSRGAPGSIPNASEVRGDGGPGGGGEGGEEGGGKGSWFSGLRLVLKRKWQMSSKVHSLSLSKNKWGRPMLLVGMKHVGTYGVIDYKGDVSYTSFQELFVRSSFSSIPIIFLPPSSPLPPFFFRFSLSSLSFLPLPLLSSHIPDSGISFRPRPRASGTCRRNSRPASHRRSLRSRSASLSPRHRLSQW